MRRNGHWLYGGVEAATKAATKSATKAKTNATRDGGGKDEAGVDGTAVVEHAQPPQEGSCVGRAYRDLAKTSPVTTGKAVGPRWAGGPGG